MQTAGTLRGNLRVTSGYPPGTLYISPGPNLENPAKFGQNLANFVKISEIWRKNYQNFHRFLTKILSIENGAKECIMPLCRSRRELSNAYLLAKIGVDTAENEPSKVCPLSVYRSPRFFEKESLKKTAQATLHRGCTCSHTDVSLRCRETGKADVISPRSGSHWCLMQKIGANRQSEPQRLRNCPCPVVQL